jgi:hypothetical protein
MFHRSQLGGYADQIQDDTQKAEFRRVVDTISFDDKGLCSGAAIDVMDGTDLENLKQDFVRRHIEFMADDVWKQISSVTQ